MLTQSRLKEVLSYDPETGVFVWIKVLNARVPLLSVAGSPQNRGYLCIGIDNKRYLSHRLAWLYVTGEFPKQYIDHANGIKTDNRFANLRDVSRFQNMQNIHGLVERNTSGFAGCFWHKEIRRFTSQIVANGKRHYLGCFKTKEEAAEAYRVAKLRLHAVVE